jgi:surfactin synthase thioesterase subunit
MNQKINIFCLPFAGGNQHSYRQLTDHESEWANWLPVELPGRGIRTREALLTDVHAMANDVFDQIRDLLTAPYAIYGHSMGSLIGYLLTKKIIRQQLNQPLHLFFSGAHEPSRPPLEQPRHLFSKENFIKKLKELGGSPEEVLDDPELLDFYEPLLRADFQATDTYIYEVSAPFHLPVTIMIGKEEGITMEQASAWQQETTGEVDIIQFPGNHFFIFEHAGEITGIMESKLKAEPVNSIYH